ncbi:MAG: PRC-barrel domain-containing protein, partial [Chloroflexota bacterium]
PETNEFTHLIVKTEGVERIVPAVLIQDSQAEAVVLNCTVIGLQEQPPLVETEYVRSAVEHYDSLPSYNYSLSGSVRNSLPRYDTETFAVKHVEIPLGEQEIKRGMAVFATNGRIGRIDDVIVDRSNDHITQIVLREGHLWGAKEVVIDIVHVKSVSEDGIHLNAAKAEVAQFQSTRPT